jgi:thymidylate synthase
VSVLWNQRSVDTALGLPFNIASYGLLLHLLAKESGFKEGNLIGFLGDTHIYSNHIDGLKKQLKNRPLKLPTITTHDFKSIFDWEYKDTEILDYKHHAPIKFDIAV